MTREEAFNNFQSKKLCPAHTENIINKIYDDFESRICRNCLYKIGCLILEEFSDEQKVLCFQRRWGCSEWEQK